MQALTQLAPVGQARLGDLVAGQHVHGQDRNPDSRPSASETDLDNSHARSPGFGTGGRQRPLPDDCREHPVPHGLHPNVETNRCVATPLRGGMTQLGTRGSRLKADVACRSRDQRLRSLRGYVGPALQLTSLPGFAA
jgi:hypothetical protein